MNLKISISAFLSLSIFLCSFSAHSQEITSTFETSISCNHIDSKIISVCTNGPRHGSHSCSSQQWLVGKKIALIENNFSAYQWACLPSKQGNKVIFSLGNRGNCDTCEGFGIWNPDGTMPSGLLTLDFDKEYKKAGFPAKRGALFWDQFHPIRRGLPADDE